MICIVMVLAFIGQTLANTIVCCEMNESSHQMSMVSQQSMLQDAETMDHSHHSMGHSMPQSEEQQMSADCCGIDCTCPANACSNSSIIVSLSNVLLTTNYADAIVSVTHPTNNSFQGSLFRPPIFA